MSNNEKFNALLNSCSNPRRIYNALAALAATGLIPCRVAGTHTQKQEPGGGS